MHFIVNGEIYNLSSHLSNGYFGKLYDFNVKRNVRIVQRPGSNIKYVKLEEFTSDEFSLIILYLELGLVLKEYVKETITLLDNISEINFKTYDYTENFLIVKLEEEWFRKYRNNNNLRKIFNEYGYITKIDNIMLEDIRNIKDRRVKIMKLDLKHEKSRNLLTYIGLINKINKNLIEREQFLSELDEEYNLDNLLHNLDSKCTMYNFNMNLIKELNENVKEILSHKCFFDYYNDEKLLSEINLLIDIKEKIKLSGTNIQKNFIYYYFINNNDNIKLLIKNIYNNSNIDIKYISPNTCNLLQAFKSSPIQNKYITVTRIDILIKIFILDFCKFFFDGTCIIAGGSVLDFISNINRMDQMTDVDIFFVNTNTDGALNKIKLFCSLFANKVDRTQNSIKVNDKYQFILRIYSNIEEVIMGFDVDASGIAFDGTDFWITPRCSLSLQHRVLFVDFDRMSPTYEYRLCKYASRKLFSIYVPDYIPNHQAFVNFLNSQQVNVTDTKNITNFDVCLPSLIIWSLNGLLPKAGHAYDSSSVSLRLHLHTPNKSSFDTYLSEHQISYSRNTHLDKNSFITNLNEFIYKDIVIDSLSINNKLIFDIPDFIWNNFNFAIPRIPTFIVTNPGDQVTSSFHATVLDNIDTWYCGMKK